MGISPYPSCVSLPRMEPPYPSLLKFLCERFPQVPPEVWELRMRQGKVLDESGAPIGLATPFVPQMRLFYFRELEAEPRIPLNERILFENDQLLIACKPPFLPVMPSGPYIEECLLHRLRGKTGNPQLVLAHRLDRETSGLVLLSKTPQTRGLYAGLFSEGKIEKTYEAVARLAQPPMRTSWLVENRLEKGAPWFRMQATGGPVNARSRIRLMEVRGDLGLFRLSPLTGKQHQLRLHMSGLGYPILNDRYYPELLPKQEDDFERPLQLLARRLRFRDPVTKEEMEFETERKLSAWGD